MDWGLVTEYYGKDFKKRGGKIVFNFSVSGFKEAFESQGGQYPIIVSAGNKVTMKEIVVIWGDRSSLGKHSHSIGQCKE